MSIKKVGGIWFIKLGRVGFNFYISKKKTQVILVDKQLDLQYN